MTTRRDFLKTGVLAGAALGTGVATHAALGAGPSHESSRTPGGAAKRLLILGGTGFIGPSMVEYALSRGHEVTIFNRGRTNTHLFPGVEKLIGDRASDLSALERRSWDVVIDNHATLPAWVRDTAQLLKGNVGQYIHVSTISVYASASFEDPDGALPAPGSEAEDARRMDEDSELAALPEDYDGSDAVTGLTYGPFKWMAENEARAAFGESATIVRPGLIVGPLDPTDRFTYWPLRMARGGEVLAPGDGHDPVQVIDARDLTAWIVRLAESGTGGTYNATGPEGRLSTRDMLTGVRDALEAEADLTWVSSEFLAEHSVSAWGDLPVWIPRNPLTFVRNARAVAAGLTFRPLADTARDTLAWDRTREPEEVAQRRAGLSPEREARVLQAWHARSR